MRWLKGRSTRKYDDYGNIVLAAAGIGGDDQFTRCLVGIMMPQKDVADVIVLDTNA